MTVFAMAVVHNSFSVNRVWEHSLLEPSSKPEAYVHLFPSAHKPCHIAKLSHEQWVVGYEGALLLSVTLQGLLAFSASTRHTFPSLRWLVV